MNTRKRFLSGHDQSDNLRITSPANPRIKALRSLKSPHSRDTTGVFFIEGYHIVREAFETGAAIEQVVVAPDLLPVWGQHLVTHIRNSGVPCLEVSAAVFETLSSRDGPQGMAAVVQQRWTPLEQCSGAGRWVALESVQYPGNLGTILRTCDATGCIGVILLGDATDPYEPTAVRASIGAVLSQTLVRTSLPHFIEWIQREQIRVIGTSPGATLSYQEARYTDRMVLCMGSERDGLSAEQQNVCDLIVRIPMAGRRDSLNLAVATAIVLYEIFTTTTHPIDRRTPAESHAAQPPPSME